MLTPRPIGKTGLMGTQLAFGSAPLATQWWNNTEAVAVDAVAAAVRAGIAWFDTAPLYGSGEAEERLGAGLRVVPDECGGPSFTIATKVGRAAEFDFSAGGVRASLEASLERLGFDHIDVVHIHDPDDHLAQAIDETFPTLCAMRDEGLLRAISVGTMQPATALHLLGRVELDLVMIANRLTLLDASALHELVPACVERGVAVLAAAVFNSGVLARPEAGVWFDYASADEAVLARVRAMARVCSRFDVSLKAAAMQFPLRHVGVDAVVVGMATAAQVDENVALFEQYIPDEAWDALSRC
jgi:D-threo-aldose 1-dehydrogenase